MRGFLCSFVAIFMALAGASAPGWAQKPGGTLNMIVQPEPPTINLGANKLGPSSFVGSKIYEGLITLSPKLEPIPMLAESWTISPDGLTYTFNLRKGVTWHDGKPFTSADVLFSFKEYLPAVFFRTRQVMGQVEDISAPDESTVVFRLKKPFPAFMLIFEATGGTIMPRHLYEGVSDFRTAPANNNFVGTGPFKFKEWRKGSFIHLVKNPDYWDKGKPYLNEIYFHIVPDANGRAIAFETGKVDVLRGGDVENFDIKRLAAEPGTTLSEDGWQFLDPLALLNINVLNKPLDDVRFRRAIAHALDTGFIIDTIFAGFGRQVSGPLTYRHRFKDESVETKLAYDPAKAKALLDEMGLKPGPGGVRAEIRLLPLPYGETWQRLAEYTRERLGSVGIKANIVATDVPGWFQRITSRDYDIAYNFVYLLGDPAIGVNQTYLTNKGDNAGSSAANVMGYSNPRVDELLGAAANENDPAARARLYAEFQKIVSAEVPAVWTHQMAFPTIYRTRVKNLLSTGLGANENFANVWIDK